MTLRLLWFVLAGFLLGFAASTLWEWLHFRRERMKLTDRRILELETQLHEQERLLDEERTLRARAAPWYPPDYQSPGVFLDSEAPPGEPEYEGTSGGEEEPPSPEPIVERSHSPPPPEPAVESSPPPVDQDEQPDSVFEVVEVSGADDRHTVVEFVEPEPEPAPQPVVQPAYRPTVVKRSTDFPDDLSKIKGIGDVYRFRLYTAGIYTWHEISQSNIEVLRTATKAYPSSNVHEWPDQARQLAEKNGRVNAVYSGPPPDDLTRIVGIGPVGSETLYRFGVCTYEQLAAVMVDELHELFPIAVAGDEPDFDHWIEQAIEFASKKGARQVSTP